MVALEAELAEVKAKVIELQEEQVGGGRVVVSVESCFYVGGC